VPEAVRPRTLQALRGVGSPAATDDRGRGRIVLAAPEGSRTLTEALRRLHAVGVTPEGLALHKPTLDEVFLALTGQLPGAPSGNRHHPAAGTTTAGGNPRR
jgi:ABC-2 type transport system ATP-binding protein